MMRRILTISCALVPCVLGLVLCGPAAGQEKAAPIELVKDGKSDYVVVISKDASPSEKWAAKDFVDHIKKMSGAELAILERDPNDKFEGPAKCVYIGPRGVIAMNESTLLPDEQFEIKSSGARLSVWGGGQRGTMYGVYTLLEKLGCRWWYPGASTIPQTKNITIPALDERGGPAFVYRDYLYGDMGDNEEAQLFRARNKLNGGFYKTLKPEYGGVYTFDTLVHSYGRLMPEANYFAAHPEYYALRGTARNPGQPCFSNPEVVKIMAAELIKEIGQHPEWNFVTVGQNDNGAYCQCDDCKKLAEKYGLGGMQLHFAKEVGKVVRQKYPNIWVNVPAYRWSRKPPTGIAPDEKSFITLCSIECNFGQPLAEGWPKENADFKADLVGWGDLAPRLLVWDYTTDFVHYILPFPNYYSLAANVKFFADHKVRGYMGQGSHTTQHGQFAPLCMWVLAKALWDPNQDGKKLVEEFCLGYYGDKAGKLVLEYANALQDSVTNPRTPVWAAHRTFLSAPYLSPELMARGDALFRRAEAAVKDDPDLLARVRADHVPVLYMLIKRWGEMGPPAAKATPGLTAAEVFKNFAEYGKAAGITRESEGGNAAPLFAWAMEYGPKKTADPSFDLPEEVRKLDGAKVYLLHAAQFDQAVRFLKKMDGASDGWAATVPGPGWSVTHAFAPPWGIQEGKAYRLFIRAKATAAPSAGSGQAATAKDALSTGIHVTPPQPRTCQRTVKASEVNGQWQVYDIGPWAPAKEGGSFFIATGREGVSDAAIDCMWLVEMGAAPATKPAK